MESEYQFPVPGERNILIRATVPVLGALNVNSTKGKAWGASSSKVKNLREQGSWLLREQHRGRGNLFDRCLVRAVIAFPDRTRRDASNWYLTAKALVDGMVDAKLVEDDDNSHMIGPHLYPADHLSKPGILEIRFHIHELPA